MGLMDKVFTLFFGGGQNVVAETAQVFRENAEAGAQRRADYAQAALAQYGAEFQHARKGWFDRMMDGLNRLPRPLFALGTIGLFVAAMWAPLWFAERMQGLALVPEPLWWLLGVIVSFYFGARHQAKAQQFQREVATSMARVPQVLDNIKAIRALRFDSPGVADTGTDAALTQHATATGDNLAVDMWRLSIKAGQA